MRELLHWHAACFCSNAVDNEAGRKAPNVVCRPHSPRSAELKRRTDMHPIIKSLAVVLKEAWHRFLQGCRMPHAC